MSRLTVRFLLQFESSSDREFDRRVGVRIISVQVQWFSGTKRRLGHKPRLCSSIDLSGMDQKRVAEVNCACRASGKNFLATRSFAVVQVSGSQSNFSSRFQHPGNLSMGTCPDACRRIPITNIRKEEQHQQRPPA